MRNTFKIKGKKALFYNKATIYDGDKELSEVKISGNIIKKFPPDDRYFFCSLNLSVFKDLLNFIDVDDEAFYYEEIMTNRGREKYHSVILNIVIYSYKFNSFLSLVTDYVFSFEINSIKIEMNRSQIDPFLTINFKHKLSPNHKFDAAYLLKKQRLMPHAFHLLEDDLLITYFDYEDIKKYFGESCTLCFINTYLFDKRRYMEFVDNNNIDLLYLITNKNDLNKSFDTEISSKEIEPFNIESGIILIERLIKEEHQYAYTSIYTYSYTYRYKIYRNEADIRKRLLQKTVLFDQKSDEYITITHR